MRYTIVQRSHPITRTNRSVSQSGQIITPVWARLFCRGYLAWLAVYVEYAWMVLVRVSACEEEPLPLLLLLLLLVLRPPGRPNE